ncbi:hypothetical protein C0995_002624 [Termitomyces sp. Mi166|nr:hypothetical protein C0995_002624 [Termitomyces sp. Mi166\
MPVTEVAVFQLVELDTLQSEPVISLLARGIRNQITYSSTPVYLSAEAMASIERHKESIRNGINTEVMTRLVPTHVTFKGLVHPAIAQKFVAAEGPESAKDIFVPTNWMYAAIDGHGEGHRISAYGTETGVEVLTAAENVTDTVVLKWAHSFRADSTTQVV